MSFINFRFFFYKKYIIWAIVCDGEKSGSGLEEMNFWKSEQKKIKNIGLIFTFATFSDLFNIFFFSNFIESISYNFAENSESIRKSLTRQTIVLIWTKLSSPSCFHTQLCFAGIMSRGWTAQYFAPWRVPQNEVNQFYSHTKTTPFSRVRKRQFIRAKKLLLCAPRRAQGRKSFFKLKIIIYIYFDLWAFMCTNIIFPRSFSSSEWTTVVLF